nr:hypothetical protein [Tanacetum cinerariifolium]
MVTGNGELVVCGGGGWCGWWFATVVGRVDEIDKNVGPEEEYELRAQIVNFTNMVIVVQVSVTISCHPTLAKQRRLGDKPASSHATHAPAGQHYGAPQASLYSAPPPYASVSYPPQITAGQYPPPGGYPAPSPSTLTHLTRVLIHRPHTHLSLLILLNHIKQIQLILLNHMDPNILLVRKPRNISPTLLKYNSYPL